MDLEETWGGFRNDFLKISKSLMDLERIWDSFSERVFKDFEAFGRLGMSLGRFWSEFGEVVKTIFARC